MDTLLLGQNYSNSNGCRKPIKRTEKKTYKIFSLYRRLKLFEHLPLDFWVPTLIL